MADFEGTDRYELIRLLGAGGMGIVYEVLDRERGERVALKTLNHVSASGIYDLKQEFRSLADVRHPNVVSLYEVVNAGDLWFFTMELVEGTSFLDYVRPQPAPDDGDARAPEIGETRGADADGAASQSAFDESRLRHVLAQLVEGVSAIHAATKLHRDLKPSNVLVTREGRVVVLDFGLVQAHASGTETADTSLERNLVVGTPAYMAPEQAAGRRATPASDWYAVGTMLYRALTGALPFAGTLTEVLIRKQSEEPEPPSNGGHAIPGDLERLAMQLLRREPNERPDQLALREALRLSPAPRASSIPAPREQSFVGRRRELELLDAALSRSRRGQPQCVFIEARSGLGKTALLNEFAERARERRGALVLRGRCYPRESLPYKAFDAIIDALSGWLARLPESAAAELLPRNRRALTSLFPVLQRVPVVEVWDSLAPLPSAPAQRRARAFDALRDLLGRVSDQSPLLLHLDNLEWGDADSAELLEHLCGAPDPPAMLVVGTHRRDASKSAFFSRLAPTPSRLGEAERVDIELPPLSVDESRLVSLRAGAGPSLAQRIAADSGGNPLLIRLLCRQLPEHLATGTDLPSADRLLTGELDEANHATRKLLEVLAVAGAPLRSRVASQAAALQPEEARASLAELTASQQVELLHEREGDAIALRHDRIAHAILAGVSESQQAALHGRVAEALEESAEANAEALGEHFAKAGIGPRALHFLSLAAQRAEASLAFEQAAALYERALQITQTDADRRKLWLSVADARLHLGDPGRAATALLEAAALTHDERASELRRRAASLQFTDAQLDALFSDDDDLNGLFHGVSRSQTRRFISRGQIVEARKGELVARANDPTPSVLVVLGGELGVAQAHGTMTLKSGELLGALSFLQGSPRTADVRATQDDTRVLSITRESLDELSVEEPQLALQLTVNLARILCSKLVSVKAMAFRPRQRGDDGPSL